MGAAESVGRLRDASPVADRLKKSQTPVEECCRSREFTLVEREARQVVLGPGHPNRVTQLQKQVLRFLQRLAHVGNVSSFESSHGELRQHTGLPYAVAQSTRLVQTTLEQPDRGNIVHVVQQRLPQRPQRRGQGRPVAELFGGEDDRLFERRYRLRDLSLVNPDNAKLHQRRDPV